VQRVRAAARVPIGGDLTNFAGAVSHDLVAPLVAGSAPVRPLAVQLDEVLDQVLHDSDVSEQG
jgi:hypothetical protein